jgi:hypothetical protein
VDLEAAVLRAVREAIDEQVAEHALSVALAELQRRIDAVEPLKLERQLRERRRFIRGIAACCDGSRSRDPKRTTPRVPVENVFHESTARFLPRGFGDRECGLTPCDRVRSPSEKSGGAPDGPLQRSAMASRDRELTPR